jgi:hypothetical protein
MLAPSPPKTGSASEDVAQALNDSAAVDKAVNSTGEFSKDLCMVGMSMKSQTPTCQKAAHWMSNIDKNSRW